MGARWEAAAAAARSGRLRRVAMVAAAEEQPPTAARTLANMWAELNHRDIPYDQDHRRLSYSSSDSSDGEGGLPPRDSDDETETIKMPDLHRLVVGEDEKDEKDDKDNKPGEEKGERIDEDQNKDVTSEESAPTRRTSEPGRDGRVDDGADIARRKSTGIGGHQSPPPDADPKKLESQTPPPDEEEADTDMEAKSTDQPAPIRQVVNIEDVLVE